MYSFDDMILQPCKDWVAQAVDNGFDWDLIENLCVEQSQAGIRLEELKDEEGFPESLTIEEWKSFLKTYKENIISVKAIEGEKVIAIDTGALFNRYNAPSGYTSSWEQYKQSLKSQMSDVSISNIQKSCVWILNHLKNDTRTYGPVKGLVTGSVQSGKTANMEGLVSMAADYDWNYFIILSGTIDNLRKQTRDRFMGDLKNSDGVYWRVLDFTGPDKKFGAEEMKLNPLFGSKTFGHRYVTVCLKNKKRLERLIDWLYDDPIRTAKLRIVVIDDEADQASINTAEITDDEFQERCAINQMIVNLVNGKKSDGSTPSVSFQAMNYISYTATPYANVLNESGAESLYPKDFICTLPEAYEYFGAKVIFGNNEQDCPGFGIVREVSDDEEKSLGKVHKEQQIGLPESMKRAIAWFLCSSAVLRQRGHKKSISMLIHTASIQKYHFVIYERIKTWLGLQNEVIEYCKNVYENEKDRVTIADLREANPNYTLLEKVVTDNPVFSVLRPEIEEILAGITNIGLGDDKELTYSTGLHLCVDNCKANKEAEEGTYLRIVYPTKKVLESLEKAPIFLVIGGNPLSRGLTIDGLVCTYFSRTSNQADTLMQMARWFGYRAGYELLQRIWMTIPVLRKFKALTKIDMDLKKEVERFMEQGISPSKFGPRIRNVPEIAKFRITAKKKSQQAEYADFDFCGDSYETTDFDEDDSLLKNIQYTEKFLKKINDNHSLRSSTAANAFIWSKVAYEMIRNDYLAGYHISQHSSLFDNLRYFNEWMESMNSEGKYLYWNIAVIDGDNKTDTWNVASGVSVGKAERTRKTDLEYIDIGSLRSGRDAICDVDESSLSPEQAIEFQKTRKNGKDIISKRSQFNLEDTPLLLIYRIKKDGGVPRAGTKSREKMNLQYDIIGISIIVPGDSIGGNHAKSIRIFMPSEENEV